MVRLTTLRERRIRGDLIETFKTLGGINRIDRNAWFNVADVNARATRMTSSVTEGGGEERKTNILRVESVRLEEENEEKLLHSTSGEGVEQSPRIYPATKECQRFQKRVRRLEKKTTGTR